MSMSKYLNYIIEEANMDYNSQNPSFILESKEKTKFESRPIPKLTNPNDVLLAVQATGICGSEIHYLMEGRIGDFIVDKPMVLGHESSGIVVEVGKDVTQVKKGDRVAMEPGIPCRLCTRCREGKYNLCPKMQFAATPPIDGTLARYYILPEDFVYKLPKNATLIDGAAVEPLAVAVHFARQASVAAGKKVVVFGAGPVGLYTGKVCTAMGVSELLVVDIADKRLEVAQKFCPAQIFKAGQSKEGDKQQDADKITAQFGEPDIVIDASGAEPSIRTGIKILRAGGTYIQGGMGALDVNFPIATVATKEITVKGSFRYGPGDYELALSLIASGKVHPTELVTGVYKFEDAEKAIWDTKDAKGIKLVVLGPDVKKEDAEAKGE
jgi:D-xylulose reductase